MTDASRLLTVKEVAERLRIPEDTLRIWLRQGRIRGFRPGGKKTGWRITESDLTEFIERRTNALVPDTLTRD